MNIVKLRSIKFWGAATSAHQIEGRTHNQWTIWELANASELAARAKSYYKWLPNWKQIKNEASSPQNYVSGIAIDSYNRYEEDFELAQNLNMNALRISIEWSRVQPKRGEFDFKVINHYRQVLSSLRRRGIEPIVTIWHWTNPMWFEEVGGFSKKSNVNDFLIYVEKMAVELGDKIDYFITINEPQNYAWYSYGSGLWPPQKTNYLSVIKVMLNLAYAHKQAYKIIKSVNKRAQVGVASSLTHNVPFRPKNIIHKISAKLANYANNWWFIDQTENEQDFIGCNYYFKNYSIRPTPEGNNNPAQPLNDLGWYMEPRAISELLIATHKRYLKPIIITENGVADRSDQYRKWWLEETLRGMSEALSGGVIIVGYLHWSLLDNFEWAHGFWPRFGLIEVDRQTLGRKIRPSAKWFGDFIQTVRSKTADH